MKILKTIIHFLANLSYLLILVYALVCVPILFDYNPLVVLSGSMEPTYKVGSVIYYKKVLESEIKEQDVVTFDYGDETFITHRVVSIVNGEYETKGDANNSADARKIEFSNIHGKVAKKSIPYIGYYIYFVNNHLYLVGIVVLILVSEFLLSNVKAFDIDKKI